MIEKFKKPFTVLMLIACIVLLQSHSIPFWLEQTNSDIGYLWSFTIEGASLWLWLNKKVVLATVASFIVILVPIAQLSKPLLSEIRQVTANTQVGKLNSLDLKQSEFLQEKYLGTNWAGYLNKNTEHFRGAINTQKELLRNSAKLKSKYEIIFIFSLQILGFIVLLLTQIKTLKILSFRDSEKDETTYLSDFEITETDENRAEILLAKIDKYLADNNIIQLDFANKLDVRSSSISKLRNRVKGVGERLSNKKLIDLENKFMDYF